MYDSFEALLEELGFQIEFVADELGSHENTTENSIEMGGDPAHAHYPNHDQSRVRSRRASFNSIYDAEDEDTKAIRSRRASMSRIDLSERSVLEVRPSTRATTRITEKTTSNASPSKSAALHDRRDRLTAEEFANTLQQAQTRRKIGTSRSHRREQQVDLPATPKRHVPIRAPPSMTDLSQAASEAEDPNIEAFQDPHGSQPAYSVAQQERLYNPSRTQLLRDAETFHHYRIRSVARDIVDKWCYAALQGKYRHEQLDRLAAAHDAEILLRQAFEHWRVRLHERKQAAYTERYFKAQERRIVKARDLMLLAKAFSHWEQCAREERIRASNARQHILSIKYFQAWKDVTLTNQRNIRLQARRKFFGIWKQRLAQVLKGNVKADLVRHERIAKNAYWNWFWTFCEMRSPKWRDGRLRRKYLFKWVAAFRSNNQIQQQSTWKSDDVARRKIMMLWAGKIRVILGNLQQASALREKKVADHALQALRSVRLYAPLSRQVSNIVDWRVAGTVFAIFVSRYRFEKQAEAVSRLRILRNTWTMWNDGLRWRTVAHRIDDRYCLESLYHWVIAERFILLQRLCKERLKQKFLSKLRDESSLRSSHRERNYDLVLESQRKASLQHFLVRWHSILDSHRHSARMAFEFHAPKITQEALQSWSQSLRHQRTLQSWAKDARFYFVTRRMLKLWQTASIESKRQKRKLAYIQVRRKAKMNLAGAVLQRWHGASTHVTRMQQAATATYQDRLLQVGAKLFDEWQAQSDLRTDQDSQANEHYSRRLLERHLYTWIEKLEEQSRLEELADLNYDMRIKNVAFIWFNKLRLKIIEQKGQESNAENLRVWYSKRHSRNLLRHWQDQTTKKLKPQEKQPFSSRPNRTRLRAAPAETPITRAEDWTDFDIGDWIPALEAQSSTTPLPGYLSTPSKRAARAKALVRGSTTPAGTPFEQRLRPQIGATPRTGRRFEFGRSVTAMKGSTFGAIMEDEPRTPGVRREG